MTSNSTGTNRLDFYSIICGVFLYHDYQKSPGFVPWPERIAASANFFSYLRKTYYENYFNNIFLEEPDQKTGSLNTILHHETKRDLLQTPLVFELKAYPEHSFQITWFDRYLFSDGIGIYGFKVEFPDKEEASFDVIATLIRLLRNTDCEIVWRKKTTKLDQLINEFVLPGLLLPPDWDKHVATLKHYTVVNDLETNTFNVEKERTLFELAHAMPLGTVSTKSSESPTEEYYQKVFLEGSVGIYGNWKAISLLDSFTRLSTQFPDTFRSWELDYFHIYIYCLYCKYQLYHFNDQWKAASANKKKATALKEKFVAFVSDYSSATISYKFLPNLLFEKMNASMEIQKELDTMEKKMNRITEVAESKTKALKDDSHAGLDGSVIIPGFNYDIFISYGHNDNKLGWVTEFVDQLKDELASTMKDPVNIYFDKNREDSILETHQVNKSIEGKLNCLILIPVVSHTYCDKKSFSWQHELAAFNRLTQASHFGRDVMLENGNVSSRILPVSIHELDEDDRVLFESELGGTLRSVEFIYREPGVNRPLKPDDNPKENLSKTSYRNQLNKLANAIREVVKGMKMSKKEN